MRATLAVGTLFVVGFALLTSAPTAMAATCSGVDVPCCTMNETGIDLSRCLACIAIGGFWNTDTNQCAIP